MNIVNKILDPPFYNSHILNPPEVEKILDTTLSKENQRFYKVKWVKVTWESENDLGFCSHVIDHFWSQYTRECLLQSNQVEPSTGSSCRFSSTLDKAADTFVNLETSELIATTECNTSEHDQEADTLFPHSSAVTSNDMLSITGETPTSNNILNPAMLTDSSLPDISEDYSYVLETETNDHSMSPAGDIPIDAQQEISTTATNTPSTFTSTATVESTTNSDFSIKQVSQLNSSDFPSCDKLLDHDHDLNVTTEEKPPRYDCTLCNATFTKDKQYLKHKQSHQDQKCKVCGKEFQRMAHLRVHMNVHDDARPFSCDQCTKSFRDKSSLKKHILVHSNPRQHKCTLCDMSFNRAQHLKRHIESHQQIKHFQCLHCDKRFNQKSAFTVHLNVHSGSKPFTCKSCGSAFGDRSALRRHCLTHNKPFKCTFCTKSFARDSALSSHIKSKHCCQI